MIRRFAPHIAGLALGVAVMLITFAIVHFGLTTMKTLPGFEPPKKVAPREPIVMVVPEKAPPPQTAPSPPKL